MPNGKHPLTVDDLRVHTREIINHFQASQQIQDTKMDKGFAGVKEEFSLVKEDLAVINTKLDAIMSGEVLVTRKQFYRLLQSLSKNGIQLNEAEILAA